MVSSGKIVATQCGRKVSFSAVPITSDRSAHLYTHAAALLRRQERSDRAERLVALADLVAQTSRFVDRQPLEVVLGRQDVACLLSTLKEKRGKALRSILKDASGLADAHLSRVLGILSAHALIRRRRLGKEARPMRVFLREWAVGWAPHKLAQLLCLGPSQPLG
jgi:hypothetical protein